MTKLACDIILDLLPSYADGLTSQASNEAVESHLAACPVCRAAYAAMQEGTAGEDPHAAVEHHTETDSSAACRDGRDGAGDTASARTAAEADNFAALPEIDYLKKIRVTNRKKICAAVLIVLILVGFGIWTKIYLYGSPIDDFHMMMTTKPDSRVVETETYTDENGENWNFSHATAETLVFNCWIENSSGLAFSHYKLKEAADGLDVIVYAVPISRFHQVRTFQVEVPVTYDTEADEMQPAAINIKGDTIDRSGLITKKAKALYAARNPFIGDISADQRLANTLGIGETIGSYTNKLYTEESEGFEYPYSWELIFDRPWTDGYDKIYNQKMRSYAYALIALIENCGEIKWTYRDADGASHTQSVTLTDWSAEYPNNNINPGIRLELKDYAAYDYRVQSLLTMLDIY